MDAQRTARRGRRPGIRRRSRGIARLLGGVLVIAGLVAGQHAPAAEAQVATGGSGRFLDAIDWVTWGTAGAQLPTSGFSGISTRVVGGVDLETTCVASRVTSSQRNQSARMLTAYQPGSFAGDGLDDLYNVGGVEGSNRLVNGVTNAVGGALVAFDVDCSATAGGVEVPLAGLVVADAEGSVASQNEYVAASPGPEATWRIIDRHRTSGCRASTNATVDAANALRLAGTTLCTSGPSAVAFMEGVTAARLTMQGGGFSAMALGVVVVSDFADAPASYGDVGHIASPGFAGGTLATGVRTAVHESTFALGTARGGVAGLGPNLDPEVASIPSVAADGDDRDGGSAFGPADDEDALASTSITGSVGQEFSAPTACRTAGAFVRGWIDWNRDGDFADAGEDSDAAVCDGTTASVTWTVSEGAVGQRVGAATFLRLRSAVSAAEIASSTGLAYSGEVEDHRVTLDLSTTIEVEKEVVSRAEPGDDFIVTIGDAASAARIASASTGAAASATTDSVIVAPGRAYAVGEVEPASGFVEYETPAIACTVDGAPVAATGIAPTWGLPALAEAQRARCVITNEALVSAIALDKTVGELVDVDADGVPSVGDTLSYAFAVENLGTAPLTDLAIDDALVAATCPQGSLAVGESIDCGPVVYALTAADLAAGAVVNTATVRAADPGGDPVTATDAVTSTLAVVPQLAPDIATTAADTPVAVDVLANDRAGSDADVLDPASVRFPADGQPEGAVVAADARTLTVPGEGTYAVDPTTGVVTFAPEEGFDGAATPVRYSAANLDGDAATASIAVTVGARPTASDDEVGTPIGTSIAVDVLRNDDAADGRALDPASVRFPVDAQPARAVVAPYGRRLTMPGEGAYAIDPATGVVTFTPDPGFSGPASPVAYVVADDLGSTTTALLAITVGPPPIAARDTATTPSGVPTGPIDVLGNDVFDGGDPVDPTTVVFPDAGQPGAGQPDGAVVSDDGRTLALAGTGSFVVGADGTVVFTPERGFSGDVPPVTYAVSTASGAATRSTLAVTVLEPIEAIDDDVETPAGAPVTIAVLDNDLADLATPLDPTTVRFPTDGQPVGATVSDDGRSVTVPREGVYAIDPATGAVVFTPEPTFTGVASPVTYAVVDVSGLGDAATITVTVGALPVAADDVGTTTQGAPIAIDVLANDGTPTGPTVPAIDATSVVLPAAGQPEGAMASADGRTLTVPGIGTYVADPTTGVVTFTPAADFSGRAPLVVYEVSDVNGAVTSARLVVDVASTPVGAADTGRTPFGQPSGPIDLLANDTTDPDETLDPTTVVFPTEGQPAGATVAADGKGLTVLGEGSYVIDPSTGTVVLTPATGFAGAAAPVTYRATDSAGGVASSTLVVTVGTAPIARDDRAGTLPGEPVGIDVLANDRADAASALDPATVAFPTDGQPAGATVSADRRSLAVPGEGSYAIDRVAGAVTFTPEAGFEGAAQPVAYAVTDVDGSTASATITVEVARSPVLADDIVGTPYDTAVSVDVLANDAGVGLDPASVAFPEAGQPVGATMSDDGRALVMPGEGAFAIGDDGSITFDPEPGLSGATTTPVVYRVTDANGLTGTAQLRVEVAASPPAPPPPSPSPPAPSSPAPSSPAPSSPAPSSPAPSSPAPTPSPTAGPGGGLPQTGAAEVGAALLAGMAALLAGLVLVAVRRRTTPGR